MTEPLRITLGDVVRMRKPHPCGTNEWEIIRTGMDIRLRCLKCGRAVLLPRAEFERQVKEFVKVGAIIGGPRANCRARAPSRANSGGGWNPRPTKRRGHGE